MPKIHPLLKPASQAKPLTVGEQRALAFAAEINAMHSPKQRTEWAVEGVRSYVAVSNHPIPKKLRVLKAALARTDNLRLKQEILACIKRLKPKTKK